MGNRNSLPEQSTGVDRYIPNEPSYTLAEFCQCERMSLTQYYRLVDMGVGPVEMRLPGTKMVRITHRARLAWQDLMLNLPAHLAAKVAETKVRMQEIGHAAAVKSVASKNHISKWKVTPPRAHTRRRQLQAAEG
jgi:hypothetical protein